MRIGILGSGLMGGKLGTLFARGGHEVVFSYARSGQKLKRLAREARGNAQAGTPGEASHTRIELVSRRQGAPRRSRAWESAALRGLRRDAAQENGGGEVGSPYENRTRISALRGPRPNR